ncbi:MAG TPA: hypothetical protein VEC02_05475 [Nitrososphaerales archaeon]|nr:hypothetical protein [Nitrososphaerales archaeon]
MAAGRVFYCPKCRRMYFLPSNAFYLCNEERNFGFPSNEPWAIPEFADYDAGARTLSCLLSPCGSPTRRHPSREHAYELMTRDEIILKFRDSVLVEASS